MHKYSIAIPNKRVPAYKLITAIVLFMSMAMVVVFPVEGWKKWIRVCIVIINLAGLAEIYLLKNSNKKYPYFIFLNSVIWLIYDKYWLAVCLQLFFAFALNTSKDKAIHFSEEGIIYPSFPEKKIPWAEVSFVKLKDDILTIDLKNNQLLQFTLMPEAVENINVEEFNGSMGEWVNV